jgi:tetratricopeptide (TPR) repeat protein
MGNLGEGRHALEDACRIHAEYDAVFRGLSLRPHENLLPVLLGLMAQMHFDRGELAVAERLLAEAQQRADDRLHLVETDEDSGAVRRAQSNPAYVHTLTSMFFSRTGEYALAFAEKEAALSRRAKAVRYGGKDAHQMLADRGYWVRRAALGDYGQAMKGLEELYTSRQQGRGGSYVESSLHVGLTRLALARVHRLLGRYEDALAFVLAAVSAVDECPTLMEKIDVYCEAALVCALSRRFGQARDMAATALSQLRRTDIPESSHIALNAELTMLLVRNFGKRNVARRDVERFVQRLVLMPVHHPERGVAHRRVAQLYGYQGDVDQARSHYDRALKILCSVRPDDEEHPEHLLTRVLASNGEEAVTVELARQRFHSDHWVALGVDKMREHRIVL